MPIKDNSNGQSRFLNDGIDQENHLPPTVAVLS